MDTIYASPVCELENLKDIFIELTAKNCNARCRECFIDFPLTKNVKDFIKTDKIKECLEQTAEDEIRCIYLTGAEPMTHPDFNSILRLCIKRANVCICTNATFINEKKARFLKNVELASNNNIMFKLSFAHWEEAKNDSVRSRGSYRQNMYALKCLDKYEFVNIINVSNYYKENHDTIISEFQDKMSEVGIDNVIIQINEWVYSNKNYAEDTLTLSGKTDCMSSRTLTDRGVFACPFLANDYRGRMGSDFSNYSKNVRLETEFCRTCIKNKDKVFTVDVDF